MMVNIFTHKIRKPTIGRCLQSFRDTFGEHEVKIWMDGENTTGLADGYIKAIQDSTYDYIFMLEHYWEFVHKPEHSLEEIVDLMREEGISHLRFNKRENQPVKYDSWLKDKGWYCETPFVSNNPHIIDRVQYLNHIKWIKRKGKDKGIEEIISKHINGAIYGGRGYTQVINHLRGR